MTFKLDFMVTKFVLFLISQSSCLKKHLKSIETCEPPLTDIQLFTYTLLVHAVRMNRNKSLKYHFCHVFGLQAKRIL